MRPNTDKICVYVAAPSEWRDEAAKVAQALRDAGFLIVSTWHDGEKDYVLGAENCAFDSFTEVSDADMVLMVANMENVGLMDGTVNAEFGFGYALGKVCVLIGKRFTKYHFLPEVWQYDNLSLFLMDYFNWLGQYEGAKYEEAPDVPMGRIGPPPPPEPTPAAERKARPLCTGVLDYFPDALMEVAHVSKVGNDQHNPGQPLHWAKEKSTDHADCILRHLKDRGKLDTDGERHSAKVAWRALALLQTELEGERA